MLGNDGSPYPKPISRSLRGFSLDPSLRGRLKSVAVSTLTFQVPWEPLGPGPTGEYLEVIDHDPSSRCFYAPVELDDPRLLAQDGLAPSEGTPQFHQQMVYAVASLTISHFEQALGRVALWSPGPSLDPDNTADDSHFIQRLRIYPHALREANAYYSPTKKALLFGYYNASGDDPANHYPDGTVFTCLSHDVIAHETTHALLDGLHRAYTLRTNPDLAAFHEAFADIVALFQHFTHPELVRHQIAEARGDLRAQETLLCQLAAEFGRTTGKRGALRDAIGMYNQESKRWEPRTPTAQDYATATEAHERGGVLVAAVFDAFLSIYASRTADLLRLATGGTGVLASGALHPDLVNRLSREVSQAASHALVMCVRALDYCPPVDLTFGEYLRAIITADHDLVPNDDYHYRTAFIEAFRKRGIFPRDLRSLSEEGLLWNGPQQDGKLVSTALKKGLKALREFANKHLYATSRREIFELGRSMRLSLHSWLQKHFDNAPEGPEDATYLGLSHSQGQKTVFEVRSCQVAYRIGPDGNILPQFIAELIQRNKAGGAAFLGGATLIADLRSMEIRYCIRKGVLSPTRQARQAEFMAAKPAYTLRDTYLGSLTRNEPFALMHRR